MSMYYYMVTGGKGEPIMKKRKVGREMPIGKLTGVKDFLPPPSQLVAQEDTKKVTIALKRSSIEFFKREAKRHRTKYQKMIRELLDRYASQYNKAA